MAIAAGMIAWRAAQNLDIGFADETGYLARGLAIGAGVMPSVEYAPLYSLWYFLVSLAFPDPLELYDASFILLRCLNGVLFYRVQRAAGVRSWFAASWTLVFVSGLFQLVVWPYPGLLCVTFILLGFRAIFAGVPWTAVLPWVFIMCVYVRPEFVLALFLAWGYALFSLRDRGRRRSNLIALGGSVALACTAVLLVGSPLGGPRSMTAFSQHYALGHNQRTGHDEDPWVGSRALIRRDFGDAQSVAGAAASNPEAFAEHVMHNAGLAVRSTRRAIGAYPAAITDTGSVLRALWPWLHVGLTLMGAWGVIVLLRGNGVSRAGLPLLGITGIVTLVSVLVVHPRLHYYVVFQAAVLLYIGLGLEAVLPSPGSRSGRWLVLLGWLPIPASVMAEVGAAPSSCPPNEAVIRMLRHRLEARPQPMQGLTAFAVKSDLSVYLPDSYQRVDPRSKRGVDWSEFVDRRGIDVVVDAERLRRFSVYNEDPGFLEFLADPAVRGWEPVDCGEGAGAVRCWFR